MKNTLYQIKESYLSLMDEIEASEGILSEDQENALEINKSELDSKSIAYLEVIKSSKAFISTIDEEIKRLEALKKRNKSLISRLEDSLIGAIELFGEFTVGTLTFGRRKSESVQVDDVNSLPTEFKNVKVTETAKKADLKAAINSGKEIDGVYIQTNFSLKIK
tara:strand:- start:342 stop:830 length:489 start_codon:yes stop_codon:yes gene_type:complete